MSDADAKSENQRSERRFSVRLVFRDFRNRQERKVSRMNVLKRAFCRTYQLAFRAASPFLPYREPKLFDGVAQLKEELGGDGFEQ